MGTQPIDIPEFFNCEWYSEQKHLKKTDKDIAEELLISLPLLAKWKKKMCIKSPIVMSGRKPNPNIAYILQLKQQGYDNTIIGKELNLTASAISYIIKHNNKHPC